MYVCISNMYIRVFIGIFFLQLDVERRDNLFAIILTWMNEEKV